MATVSEQIQEIYVGLLGRAADKTGLDYWVQQITSGNLTLEQLRANIVNEQQEYQDGLGSMTRTEVVTELYNRMFERAPEADGLEYWVNGDGASVNVDQLVLALSNGASADDRQVLDNKIEAAEYYTANVETYTSATAEAAVDSVDGTAASVAASKAATDALSGGETTALTASTDTLTGTAGADTFVAPLSQNSFSGGVSNTLSSADSIDGGAGTDTLNAVVVEEFVGVNGGDYEIDIQATTTSVENITFEARDEATGSVGGVVIDAKRMTDVVEIGSYYSDGDLTIENLTTLTEDGLIRNTESMTITMDHTEGQNSSGSGSDLTVYFDEDYLNTSTEVGGSTLLIRLVNAVENVTGDNPIFGTDSFTIDVGGTLVTVDVSDIAADDTLDFTTAYDQVVDAIDAAMVAAGFPNVTAAKSTLSPTVFSIPVTTDGTDYDVGDSAGSYYPILVTNTGSEELDQGTFQQAAVDTDTDINSSMTPNPAAATELPIEINILLEKVGRDGEGGSLVIGGKDQNSDDDDEEDQNDGFDVFDIYVSGNENQPSNLEFITSTDEALDTVNISDAAVGFEGASLTIREAFNGEDTNHRNDDNVETVNADSFTGDLTIGNDGGAGDDRMNNVDVFTATGGGDVSVWADIDGDEKGQFSMTTGSGSDMLDVTLHGDTVDTVATSFSISTGSGVDTVKVVMDEEGVSYNTTADLDNLSIDSGAGDDDVELVGGSTNGDETPADQGDGDARFNIDAGSGSDFVRIESEDDSASAGGVFETSTILLTGDSDSGETFTLNIDGGAGLTYTTTLVETVDTYGAAIAALSAEVTYDAATDTLTYTAATPGNKTNLVLTEDDGTTDNVPAALTSNVDGTTAADLHGSWSVGNPSEGQTWADRVLYQAELTVNFAGFEQTVSIATSASGNFVADQITINNAIKNAIDSNPELSKLLSYTDGTASQQLNIVSTVEGDNDLTISINQPTVVASGATTGQVNVASTDIAALEAGFHQTEASFENGVEFDSDVIEGADSADDIASVFDGTWDGGANAAAIQGNLNETGAAAATPDLVLDTGDGTDGANELSVTNYSIIDMGTGANDLVALNSDADSANTVDFTAIWDKVSIVNWFETQGSVSGNDVLTDAVTGHHILDFTVWLDDATSSSLSDQSALRTATTVDTATSATTANLNLASNEVVVINDWAQVSTDTWAGMTAADIDAALEGTTDAYGNFANAASTAVAATDAYGGVTIDSILMVENDQNQGEYKVFNVETDSTASAGSQFTVSLIGTIDFGESIDAANGLTAANFA